LAMWGQERRETGEVRSSRFVFWWPSDEFGLGSGISFVCVRERLEKALD
jgi:hypothetical protein